MTASDWKGIFDRETELVHPRESICRQILGALVWKTRQALATQTLVAWDQLITEAVGCRTTQERASLDDGCCKCRQPSEEN